MMSSSLVPCRFPSRGKFPLSIITLIILLCCLSFVVLLYNAEKLNSFSPGSVFKFKFSCPKRHSHSSSKSKKQAKDDNVNTTIDDRFDFDPEECDVMHGKWVFNKTFEPLYTDESCPYLDRQISCVKNGRPDLDYRKWEWQPDDCTLPRFNPELALSKLKGKRLMFVGDSLQRGQWESFICMVSSIIPENKRSFKFGRAHSVFKAKEYDVKIEFYWAPFLIESNTDIHIIADPKKRILKMDSIAERAKNWEGVDILVFNTYVWWMSGLSLKIMWGSFPNGEDGYEVVDTPVAYKLGLRTWANWVDSTVNPNTTRVFFTTMSPSHMRSKDWNKSDGIKCYNETRPIKKRKFWGSGADKRMMSVVANVVKRMKVPVTFINVTQLSDYRIDGHTSVYTESGGKLLTEEEKADPLRNADCIHWCLPGVPDTWNQIFLAHLLL